MHSVRQCTLLLDSVRTLPFSSLQCTSLSPNPITWLSGPLTGRCICCRRRLRPRRLSCRREMSMRRATRRRWAARSSRLSSKTTAARGWCACGLGSGWGQGRIVDQHASHHMPSISMTLTSHQCHLYLARLHHARLKPRRGFAGSRAAHCSTSEVERRQSSAAAHCGNRRSSPRSGPSRRVVRAVQRTSSYLN